MEGIAATIFVDGIPRAMSKEGLWRLVRFEAAVKDVYISRRIRRNRFGVFAFIRLCSKEAAEKVMKRLKATMILGCSLFVAMARRPRRSLNRNNYSRPFMEWRKKEKKPSMQWRKKDSSTQEEHLQEGMKETPNGWDDNMERAHSTYVDTNVYDINSAKIGCSAKNGGYPPNYIRGEKCDDNLKWLGSSLIGMTKSATTIDAIWQKLGDLHSVAQIREMGYYKFLITFGDQNAMNDETILNSLRCVFDLVDSWSESDICDTRRVWIECNGVPLHGWSYDNFWKLGNYVGEVIEIEERAVHKDEFGPVKILLDTTFMPWINHWVLFSIDGICYDVHIREAHSQFHCRTGENLEELASMTRLNADHISNSRCHDNSNVFGNVVLNSGDGFALNAPREKGEGGGSAFCVSSAIRNNLPAMENRLEERMAEESEEANGSHASDALDGELRANEIVFGNNEAINVGGARVATCSSDISMDPLNTPPNRGIFATPEHFKSAPHHWASGVQPVDSCDGPAPGFEWPSSAGKIMDLCKHVWGSFTRSTKSAPCLRLSHPTHLTTSNGNRPTVITQHAMFDPIPNGLDAGGLLELFPSHIRKTACANLNYEDLGAESGEDVRVNNVEQRKEGSPCTSRPSAVEPVTSLTAQPSGIRGAGTSGLEALLSRESSEEDGQEKCARQRDVDAALNALTVAFDLEVVPVDEDEVISNIISKRQAVRRKQQAQPLQSRVICTRSQTARTRSESQQ